MGWLIATIILIVLVWFMIVSPGFRIFIIAIVVLGVSRPQPERNRRYFAARDVYEKQCAKCAACPAQAAEENFLFQELQVRLMSLKDFPDLIAVLDAALEEQ